MKFLRKLFRVLSGSEARESARRKVFFDLLQRKGGYITTIDFAMAINSSGTDAKKALEQYSVEFDATFEVTEEGDILYRFPIGGKASKQHSYLTSESKKPESKKPSNGSYAPVSRKKKIKYSTKQTKRKVYNQNVDNKSNRNQQKQSSDAAKNTQKDEKSNKLGLDKLEEEFKDMGKSLNDLFKF